MSKPLRNKPLSEGRMPLCRQERCPRVVCGRYSGETQALAGELALEMSREWMCCWPGCSPESSCPYRAQDHCSHNCKQILAQGSPGKPERTDAASSLCMAMGAGEINRSYL